MRSDASSRVTLHLSAHCNDDCVFCSTADLALAVKTPDDVRATLQRVHVEGATEVTFVGIDRMPAPELLDAIARARAEGFARVGIQTDARQLAEAALAARLASAGATDVDVIVHAADPTAHDYHSGTPGSFAAMLSGVAAARAAGLTVVASTVLTRSNYRVLVDMPRWIAGRSIAAWCVWVPRVAGQFAEQPDRIVARLPMALPYALHALDLAAKLSLPAWIAGAPLCLLGPFAARAIADGPRAFGAPCARCPSQARCSGVDAWYLARFGDGELIARSAPELVETHQSLRKMFVAPGELTPASTATRRALLPVVRERS